MAIEPCKITGYMHVKKLGLELLQTCKHINKEAQTGNGMQYEDSMIFKQVSKFLQAHSL